MQTRGSPEGKVQEDLEKVFVEDGNEEKYFLIGSSLSLEEKQQMIEFLKANIDVFAWQPYDMLGIDSTVMWHKLHIDLTTKLIKQKPHWASPKKAKAVKEEVQKLLKVGAIRKAEFPNWISNPVVVKKHNGN